MKIPNAAVMSIEAYEAAVGGRCPFKVEQLKPSASAKKAFATAKRGHGLD